MAKSRYVRSPSEDLTLESIHNESLPVCTTDTQNPRESKKVFRRTETRICLLTYCQDVLSNGSSTITVWKACSVRSRGADY